MDMSWLFFAILAPILASFTNYIEKFMIETELSNASVFTIFVGFYYALFSIPIFLIHGFHLLPPLQLFLVLLSGACNTFYLLPYYKALTLEETSRVIPLFQFVPVFTFLLGFIFLGEVLSFQQFFGFLLVLFGGLFISIETFSAKIFKPRKVLWYMMLSSLIYAILAVSFKYVVVRQDFIEAFAYQVLGGTFGSLALLLFPKNRIIFTKSFKKLSKKFHIGMTLNMIISVTFEFCNAAALSLAPVALVMVIGGIQPIIVFIMGIILSIWIPHIIKEDISKKNLIIKTVGITSIFFGIVCLYL